MSLCFIPCVQPPSQAPQRHQRAYRSIHRRPVAASSRTADVTEPPADGFDSAPAKARVAVLFNARARRVTPDMARRLEKIVGRENTFYSHSLSDAGRHIDSIAGGGFDTLVCCGGDGTLVTAMNMMRDCVAQRATSAPMPRFAQLTLGTGNALRQVMSAGDPAGDLRNIRDGHTVDRPLSLIEDHNNTAFFFAGIGHDARLMHDYDKMQHNVPSCLSRSVMRSKLGFAAALLTRTAPHMLRHRKQPKAAVTVYGPCYRIRREHGRDTLRRVPPGKIFSGRIGMLGVGTVPWLGYDIKMFPFAQTRPGLMHLRITQMSLFGMLAHSRSLWRGTFKNPGRCHDFLVSEVDIYLDRPVHYQHSGESQGRVTRLHFGVAPNPVRLAAQARR